MHGTCSECRIEDRRFNIHSDGCATFAPRICMYSRCIFSCTSLSMQKLPVSPHLRSLTARVFFFSQLALATAPLACHTASATVGWLTAATLFKRQNVAVTRGRVYRPSQCVCARACFHAAFTDIKNSAVMRRLKGTLIFMQTGAPCPLRCGPNGISAQRPAVCACLCLCVRLISSEVQRGESRQLTRWWLLEAFTVTMPQSEICK